MAGFGVISDVSETLVAALNDALQLLNPAPIAELHDLQGNIPNDPARLAVFLYEVAEDIGSRNQPMHRQSLPAGLRLAKPPMALKLKYLITPFAGDRLAEQRILGRAMQALYVDPIFAGPDLQGAPAPDGLVDSADMLAATLDPLNLEERSRIWHAIQRPYRLSLSYQVRVANIHPDVSRRVELARSRNFDPAVPVDA
jgi:hypothetical protein